MEARNPRRWIPIGVCSVLIFIALVYLYSSDTTVAVFQQSRVVTATATVTVTATATAASTQATGPSFTPGKPDKNREYRKGIVVASIKSENTSWVREQLPDVEPYIYVVDDPEAELTVPRNWGNELMPYLTFIIDHYDKLPDIMIFVHAHEYTHLHNPAVFDYSTPAMIKRLNPQRVIREGYMNLNCGDWAKAGRCGAFTRPAESLPLPFHKQSWELLFPEYPVPQILAQECCAQFATSRERVRQVPLAKWNHFREWLLSVPKENGNNPGWVWEYMWQFVLGGHQVYCPASYVCFCDGYDLCFGGEEKFETYVRLKEARETMRQNIHAIDRSLTPADEAGEERDKYDVDRRLNMVDVLNDLDVELGRLGDDAAERAKDPKLRNEDLRKAKINS